MTFAPPMYVREIQFQDVYDCDLHPTFDAESKAFGVVRREPTGDPTWGSGLKVHPMQFLTVA